MHQILSIVSFPRNINLNDSFTSTRSISKASYTILYLIIDDFSLKKTRTYVSTIVTHDICIPASFICML